MKRLPDELPSIGDLRTLYVDLDGTLLGPGGSLFASSDGAVSGRAATAIEALHSARVGLVLVSGRTRRWMPETARILGAEAYIAELGAFLVERRGSDEAVIHNFGAFRGSGSPFQEMARSGAGAFLLERYQGRLEPHTPWTYHPREATMLFRGFVDPEEATESLAGAGYDWVTLHDNGRLSRTRPSLEVPHVHAYHLTPSGVSKASAVRLHRDRCGTSAGQTAAVGDSPSDLAIAPDVGAVFIVANGLASVGRSADHLQNAFATPSSHGDGFAEAVDALLVGKTGRD
ncbi:MAG: HAD family hydrolase [Actinomycetota bacterium]